MNRISPRHAEPWRRRPAAKADERVDDAPEEVALAEKGFFPPTDRARDPGG